MIPYVMIALRIFRQPRFGMNGARLFWLFVAGYALSRFATELFRAEFAGRLLGSQWLEAGAFVAAAGILIVSRRAEGRRVVRPVRCGEAPSRCHVSNADRPGGDGP